MEGRWCSAGLRTWGKMAAPDRGSGRPSTVIMVAPPRFVSGTQVVKPAASTPGTRLTRSSTAS